MKLNNANNKWTITLEEDPETGELILPFPPDLLEQSGWKEGDSLLWIDNNDGSWSLVKEELTTFIKNGTINNE